MRIAGLKGGRSGLAVVIALPWLLVVNPAHAEMFLKTNTKTYDISGTTARQLMDQMDRLGPRDPDGGGPYQAYTTWHVKFRYSYKRDQGSCQINNINTYVIIDYTFANWVNRHKAPKSLRRSWDRSFAGLKKHEEQHGQHGIDAAKEVTRELKKMKRKNCETLVKDANALGEEIIRQYAKRDVDFDRRTDHGAKEIPSLSD